MLTYMKGIKPADKTASNNTSFLRNDATDVDTISRNKATSTYTFDFSTLYTNIPHPKLKSGMGELGNFSFKEGDKELIGITK